MVYKIGINGVVLGAQKHGISRYTRQLLRSLAQIDSNQFDFCVFATEFDEGFNDISTVPIDKPGTPRRVLWDTIEFPYKAKSLDMDAIHTPDKGPFLRGNIPTVATIHDMLPYLYPEERALPNRKYWQLSLRRQVSLSDVIVTVSQSTKQDIVDLFSIKPEKIHVTPLGTDFTPPSKEEISNIRERYQVSQSEFSVLYVGNYDKRKNINRIIKSCQELHKEGFDLELLLAGSNPPQSQLLENVTEFRDRISFLGYVPDEDLEALYGAVDIFVYPSKYEGFGLPVLEAMACGTPVITSNTSSLPEVVGDAGITVDPEQTAALSDALHRLISSDDLRLEMTKKGLDRAAKMTWEKTARKTIEAYKSLF